MNRMKDERYPKIAYNSYVHRVRNRGRQKKRWIEPIDMKREDCEELYMKIGNTRDAGQESVESKQ